MIPEESQQVEVTASTHGLCLLLCRETDFSIAKNAFPSCVEAFLIFTCVLFFPSKEERTRRFKSTVVSTFQFPCFPPCISLLLKYFSAWRKCTVLLSTTASASLQHYSWQNKLPFHASVQYSSWDDDKHLLYFCARQRHTFKSSFHSWCFRFGKSESTRKPLFALSISVSSDGDAISSPNSMVLEHGMNSGPGASCFCHGAQPVSLPLAGV